MLAEANTWTGIVQSLIAAGSGFLGVLTGTWMTGRNQKKERHSARIREQLEEFYSPMLGIVAEIKARGEVRSEILNVSGEEWKNLFAGVKDPEEKKRLNEDNEDQFQKVIDYDELQLRLEVIPLYRKMLAHFSSHLWLAEESTRKQYSLLYEYVEHWRRHQADSIPIEVRQKIRHSEEGLLPLYDDLQMHFESLVKKSRN